MRKAAGLTQAQVAAMLGVSPASVSKIEHGVISASRSSAPTCDALGGTLDVVATLGDRGLESRRGLFAQPAHRRPDSHRPDPGGEP